MGIKRILAVKDRNKKIVKWALIVIVAVSIGLFVKNQKSLITQQATVLLQGMLSRESELEVKIGKISGKIWGEIRFDNVLVLLPGESPEADRVIFRAKRISFHYRLLDLLSKKISTQLALRVKDAELIWSPQIRLRTSSQFPFLTWMREWALTQKDHFEAHVENMSLLIKPADYRIDGVRVSYQKNSFYLELPLRHVQIAGMDVSTVIKAEGRFKVGLFYDQDSISGEIFTEGSVVNWSPLPQESRFEFAFTPSMFLLTSSDFLGGIGITGKIDFEKDFDMRWEIKAEDYPLSNISLFLKAPQALALPSKIDLELLFDGSPWAPNVEGRTRIYDGHLGRKTYKAMDVQVDGVYPTVNLTGSRVLMPDGSVMKFADKTLEFRELFYDRTYEQLVTESAQDTVIWGDWELHRPKDIKDQPEFLVQRALGERARLHFREYRQEETLEKEGGNQMEVGLEYRLLSPKDSLKVELRENDEKFVGVERKMKF